MKSEHEAEGWPLSNYPIFLALVLLATTAVTLAMGDEKRAEDLAIYAYYLLVIGVAIRFFEFALPENVVQKLGDEKTRISALVKKLTSNMAVATQGISVPLRIPRVRLSSPRNAGITRRIPISLSLPHVRLPSLHINGQQMSQRM